MKLLSGVLVAKQIEDQEILPNLKTLAADQPYLAIISVGNDSKSQVYIRQKQKKAKELGIELLVYQLQADCTFEKIRKTVDFLNNDAEISAIIVQLPLPSTLSDKTQLILNLINAKKDVDALSSIPSLSSLSSKPSFAELKQTYLASQQFLAPTAAAVMEIISFYQIDLNNIVIIGQGVLVGRPVAVLLDQLKIPYQTVDEKTKSADRDRFLKNADLIISGSSSPKSIFDIKDLKSTSVVIDCAADFDQNDINSWSGSATPPIGGVGPVTVACLMRNVVLAKLWSE